MKNSVPKIPSLKWSLSLMLIFTLAITGLMACNDMEDNGITQTEVQKTQANINRVPAGNQPLFVVNGEKMSRDKMSRLDPKYIKSVDVLKDKPATNAYGEAGKNGVVDITLSVSKEEALKNLMDKAPSQPIEPTKPGDKIYVSAQKAPKMIGGQQAITKKLSYPKSCEQAGVEGRVKLQFIVTTKGDVEKPQVVKGIGHGCDEAALKAIKQVKFKPAHQNGKVVNMRFSWPVTFKLPSK